MSQDRVGGLVHRAVATDREDVALALVERSFEQRQRMAGEAADFDAHVEILRMQRAFDLIAIAQGAAVPGDRIQHREPAPGRRSLVAPAAGRDAFQACARWKPRGIAASSLRV